MSFLPLACVTVLQTVHFLWCNHHPGFDDVVSMLSAFPSFGFLLLLSFKYLSEGLFLKGIHDGTHLSSPSAFKYFLCM